MEFVLRHMCHAAVLMEESSEWHGSLIRLNRYGLRTVSTEVPGIAKPRELEMKLLPQENQLKKKNYIYSLNCLPSQ